MRNLKREIPIGTKFGILTTLKYVLKLRENESYKCGIMKVHYYLCRCECGFERDVSAYKLIRGLTKSCGRKNCIQFKHRIPNKRLYSVWDAMRQRCTNPNNKSYQRYGGRGVSVCKEWMHNYISFFNWAVSNGWKEGLHLDKDKKGNGLLYSPETCMWVTQKENNRNTRRIKLTLQDAVNIRNSTIKRSVLAKEYNIAASNIRLIQLGKTWV